MYYTFIQLVSVICEEWDTENHLWSTVGLDSPLLQLSCHNAVADSSAIKRDSVRLAAQCKWFTL